MTSREITSVAIKVFAIYVLVQTILAVPGLVQALSMFDSAPGQGGEAKWAWVIGILAIVLLFVIFFGLWKLSNSVVNNAASPSAEEDDFKITQPFILSVVGFFFAFEGLFRFGTACVGAYMEANSTYPSSQISPQTIAYIIGYFVEAVIGFTLILRAKGWAKLLRGLREAGLNK